MYKNQISDMSNEGITCVGDGETVEVGCSATAIAGHYGHAIAGVAGTATTGHNGSATAGDNGSAKTGNNGSATAGCFGRVSAGENGCIELKWWDRDTCKMRKISGSIGGKEGLQPNTWYCCENGEFVLDLDD